ncbi:hypothetical protein OHR68_03760 [Spirillospora sp. NBC_00431]
MKLRLIGLPAEVDTAAARIATVLTVLETSRPYPRRGNSALVSLYLEVQIPAGPGAGPATPTPVPPVTGGPDAPESIPLEVPGTHPPTK